MRGLHGLPFPCGGFPTNTCLPTRPASQPANRLEGPTLPLVELVQLVECIRLVQFTQLLQLVESVELVELVQFARLIQAARGYISQRHPRPPGGAGEGAGGPTNTAGGYQSPGKGCKSTHTAYRYDCVATSLKRRRGLSRPTQTFYDNTSARHVAIVGGWPKSGISESIFSLLPPSPPKSLVPGKMFSRKPNDR